MSRFHFALAAAGLYLLAYAGCGSDPLGRHAVSGNVRIDGQLLDRGNISFQPTEGQVTSGGAVISSGKYSVPREGGLVTGKYRVAINAPVPGTGGKPDENSMPGDPPPPPKERIPPDWNVASSHIIEIRKQGPFTFDFEVSTKAK
jgi:hypothetical protein